MALFVTIINCGFVQYDVNLGVCFVENNLSLKNNIDKL